MKQWLLLVCLMVSSVTALAQDAEGVIHLSDEKNYTPRAKGLRDLVVDIVSPNLTKQLNEQMIFGNVQEAVFRVYWTAEPERVAIEVMGLPEGFAEIKQELKASMIGYLETVIPLPLSKRLASYKKRLDPKNSKVVIAEDTSHQMPIPVFEMTFAASGVIEKLVGKKPVGLVTTTYKYGQESWSDPRLVLLGTSTESQDGPQILQSTSEITYLATAGMGLPSMVKINTKQTIRAMTTTDKPIQRSQSDTINFKNYKVNAGAATKWFLGQAPPK